MSTTRPLFHPTRTVSLSLLRGFILAAERSGFAKAALAEAELSASASARDQRVSVRVLDEFCERALQVTGDPALGLHLSERIAQSTFAPVPYLAWHAASLRHAFELLARFSELFVDQEVFELIEDKDRVALRSVPCAGRSAVMRRFADEMLIAGILNLTRSVQAHARFLEISFKHAAPPYRSEYVRVLGHEVRFDQPFTQLVLERSLFDAPCQSHDPALTTALASLASDRLAELSRQLPFSQRTHNFLVGCAPVRVKMTAVAQALGLSARSLRRRLQNEGKSYAKVQYEALGTYAALLLRERRSSIKEVAYRMGFSDAPTFHRAFKRWTGKTPSDVRTLPAGSGR